ncbi:MAG: CPBP family intramembrane metalloprotease [Anaerolineales bacterium]|nr:MAG: CPBP family intramembrane metalloprotease [Anaerolineales bacterium]
MNANTFDWKKPSQLSVIQLLFAVFLPSGFAYVGFHVALPALVAGGLPVMIAWPSVASVMLLIFVILAVFLLNKEAQSLGISLWTRMCMKRLSGREWGVYILIAVVGLFASITVQSLVHPFMDVFGLGIPAYMPFFLNPAIDPMTADMSIVSPGLPLGGNYGILILMGITLLLNILTEELYFRAWMLPKLSRYGAWSWVMNGTLFALYHTFQFWLFPTLLVASLFFAFIFYKSKSIWPSFAAHLIANFLLSILGIMMLIIG